MRRICVACLVFVGLVAQARGEEWAKAMFDHLNHDFGVVARGAEAVHRFPLENLYVEDVHIASVRSTCGCTKPEVTKPLLKTYEQGEIVATLDTRSFTGRKDATLTVVLDKPFPAEVQLHVQSYIRSDVVIEPGSIHFGTVPLGTSVRKKASIVYAGRDDWKVVRVEHECPYLEVKVVEQGRGTGRVSYDLSVRLLPSAPAGYLKEQINLITDDADPYHARVPVVVEGLVVSAVTVRPSPLSFGILSADKQVTKQLVVHGKSPFSITDISCEDPRFQFVVPEGTKTLHLVPVTFFAKGPGDRVVSEIVIETDAEGGRSFKVPAFAQVVAADGSDGEAAPETIPKDSWHPAGGPSDSPQPERAPAQSE